MENKFNLEIELEKFIGINTNNNVNILEQFYEERPIIQPVDKDHLFSLPVNDNYKKTKENKKISIVNINDEQKESIAKSER